MKAFKIAVVPFGLLLCFLIAGHWLYPRWVFALTSRKVPHRAVATVIKKEHIVGSGETTKVAFPENWFIYVRLDDFLDVDSAARDAIAKAERRRYAKNGPIKLYVTKNEFSALKEGDTTEVRYSYYPNVLWGSSGQIRVPW
jgi:hypothetical protein